MSLSVLLQSVNGLRGTGDRLAKISFRGEFVILKDCQNTSKSNNIHKLILNITPIYNLYFTPIIILRVVLWQKSIIK